MRKLIISAIAATSLAGGSIAVAVTNPLGIAGAQNEPSTTATTQAPTPTTAPAAGEKERKPGGERKGHGSNALDETLKELVANGTITQAQADAILASVKTKIGSGGHKGGHDGHFGIGSKETLDTMASVIGIDAATLMAEVKAGKSVAQVAQEHGVDPQRVIDAVVAAMSAQIDKAVAEGKIPAERAAKIKASLPEHVGHMVNDTRKGGDRGKGRPGKGDHDDDDAGDDDANDDDAPATTAPPATQPPVTSAPTTAAPTTAPATTAPTTAAPTTTPGTTP